MPIFLCYDPAPRTTCWTHDKHRSMIAEFTKRRIKYFSVSTPDELRAHLENYRGEPSSLVFFPSSEKERNYLFDRYKEFDIHRIIFAHHNIGITECDFSSVMSDFSGDMRTAVSHLRERGCKNIALLGANMGGYHDKLRAETFKRFCGEDEPVIFYVNKANRHCISQLFSCERRLDAIICINDFFAFSLKCVLDKLDPEWSKKISLLSFSNTILSGLCSPSLSSISLNYIDGGKEVATIHKALSKNDRMAYMHIVMKSMLSARETTAAENPEGIAFSNFTTLSDSELEQTVAPSKKCMALEKLLALSDETDLSIMHGLIADATLGDIATRLYLTRDAIKYRVRKFKEYLKCDSTKELAAVLCAWINTDKLEDMIVKIKR